jgi:HTH-type transcriptional regulator / antitoxin HigA
MTTIESTLFTSELIQAWSTLRTKIHLKSIRTEDDYKKLVALANELADQLEEGDGPLNALFEIVSDLIAVWESRHVSLPQAEPREVLRYLLKEHNLKQKDLADIVSPSHLSDILSGRRGISKKLAKALAVRFNLDASAFI